MNKVVYVYNYNKLRRAIAMICPSPPPWAPKRLAPMNRRQCSSSYPRPTRSHAHRCSRLMRQHGSEQSGPVTLTFDVLTLKVVSESRVTWATPVPISDFLGFSVLDLGPMYVAWITDETDREETFIPHRNVCRRY